MGLKDFKLILTSKFKQRGEKPPEDEEIDEIIDKANKSFMAKGEKELFSLEIEKVQNLWETAARIYNQEKTRDDSLLYISCR